MATIKSIEEKAKAYDETIEKLRNFYRDYDTVSRLIDVKEELANRFPELAESEDERIRKEIISYLKQRLKFDSSIPAAIGYWIAWLEKQGEKKPTKWSEEDEKNIDFLIHLIEHNVPNHSFAFGDGCAYGCKSKEEAINMLKSFKDRVQPQPKQEWSEEDEDIKETIIGELELVKKSVGEINYNGYDKLIDWLKSLRPQNTWKPSDEQMRELSIVATGKGWFSKEILSELLEQLKKLREE